LFLIDLQLFGNLAFLWFRLLITLNERNELSGNVLVATEGNVLYKHSFGYANVAHKTLNTDSSTFILASLAKPFTAVAILQLKEKGKLKLDDAASKYLLDFPYTHITIRQLLSHTSGLTDLQIFEGPYRADTNKIFSNADIIPAIRADKNALIAQPGEKYSYSNTGFGILVLIVEKIAGVPFQDYLRKQVFAPAKMDHTYINSRLIDQNPGDRNRTQNYDFLSYAPDRLLVADSMKKHKIELINLSGILGPDAVISTTGDLLRFDQALYGSKLLRQSTLQEAFTPVKLNNGQDATGGWGKIAWYSGLGWMILRDSTDGKIVFHPGGDAGAVTILLRNLTRHQTVIVLDNVTHRGVHSYAEVLLLSGKNEEAIAMYQLSVKMNPGNEGAKKVLRQLENKN
jgi:CubicO group peptidase (beta-lactamase class C family)